MKNVLFICETNVGRSQMAEGFYNHFTKSKNAISAGIYNKVKKYNDRPDKKITKVMLEEGIDISKQKVKQLSKRMLKDVSRIIIMCEKEICPKFLLLCKKPLIFNTIPDPYMSDFDTTRRIRNKVKTRSQINEKISNLLRYLNLVRTYFINKQAFLKYYCVKGKTP